MPQLHLFGRKSLKKVSWLVVCKFKSTSLWNKISIRGGHNYKQQKVQYFVVINI